MNEEIQKNRKVALGILKPAQKKLEHGLKLHKNSIVCDSYGFAPLSAINGDVMKRAIEAGASQSEIQDMHEDMTKTRCVTDARERKEFMEAWKAAGVTCIFQNAGEEGQSVKRLIKRLAYFTYLTDMMGDFVQKAVTFDDIVEAKKQNKHSLFLTSNGVPLSEDWISVEEELRYIRIFFKLGIRMMHLTYNRRNMIGDGCGEPGNAGLSDFGRAVIVEMNRIGVIIDVAHSGWQTCLDAAKVSKQPIVASHSACYTLNKHIRCKSDEVIRAIADTGGYIGICAIPEFLGGKGNIITMLDHIDYVVKKFGIDHVAIGTDVEYIPQTMEQEYAKLSKISVHRKRRTRWEALWPPNPAHRDIKWCQDKQILSLAWTNWPLFTVGLVQRGYSDKNIQKILGGNVLRVTRAVNHNGV